MELGAEDKGNGEHFCYPCWHRLACVESGDKMLNKINMMMNSFTISLSRVAGLLASDREHADDLASLPAGAVELNEESAKALLSRTAGDSESARRPHSPLTQTPSPE